jgi:hypothetical protein
MRTMLVPCCMRLKCLPRTPLLKSSEGRGARGSSSLAFFILCGRAGSDETDAGGGFSVNDEEDTASRRQANGDKAAFTERVLIVGQCGGQWIVEDGHRFSEGDSMLFNVAGGFGGSYSKIRRGNVMRLFYDDTA